MTTTQELALKKIVGNLQVQDTSHVPTITFRYYVPDFSPSSPNRESTPEGVIDFIRTGGAKAKPQFYDLSKKEVTALSDTLKNEPLLKKYLVTLFKTKIDLGEILGKGKEQREEALSFIEQVLLGKDKETVAQAKLVLSDDLNFKYKSDKIKGFINLGLNEQEIEKIMLSRPDMIVTQSYVNSIREKMQS